ncbi:MAG: hypothetical protein GC180_07605 [Bacteroidetes bacterium]|nr:hypothetical protein [Bacteroidota bacterium]
MQSARLLNRRFYFWTWLFVNLILLAKYFWDAYTIHCEPCLDGFPCPPCRTAYMTHFTNFLFIWNGIFFLIIFSSRIMKAVNPPDKPR